MTKFVFDAALLERAERMRMPVRRRHPPGATAEEIDRATRFDLEHSRGARDEFLADFDVRFADSRGWSVAKKAATVAAMYFGTMKEADHGTLPPALARLDAAIVRATSFRNGQGSGIPEAIVVHATLPLLDVQAAAGLLKTAGLRPERLPFSVVNPRGAHALLVIRAPRMR